MAHTTTAKKTSMKIIMGSHVPQLHELFPQPHIMTGTSLLKCHGGRRESR